MKKISIVQKPDQKHMVKIIYSVVLPCEMLAFLLTFQPEFKIEDFIINLACRPIFRYTAPWPTLNKNET